MKNHAGREQELEAALITHALRLVELKDAIRAATKALGRLPLCSEFNQRPRWDPDDREPIAPGEAAD